MRKKNCLELADVQRIAAACRAEAERNRWDVTIVIVDDAGQLLHLERLNARPLTIDVALGKARTAVAIRQPSAVWEQRVQDNPRLMSLGLTPLRGGLPLIVADDLVGAVAVSGVKGEEDEQIAAAGVATIGLTTSRQ
jgi:glc operon protein GlcG